MAPFRSTCGLGDMTLLSGTRLALVVFMGTIVASCASVSCKPAQIVVAEKEERLRREQKTVGTRPTVGGGVEEIRRDVTVREYWVRAVDNEWYRISEEQYEVVVPNATVDVCR
jgi:hypothetical protein